MNTNHDNPLVSIIIPVHNAEKYIRDTFLTVIRQTYKNIEIVISDDGSTDASLEVIESIHTDRNVKFVKNPPVERSIARNKGVEISSGEYLLFLDSDDFLHPNCISLLVEAISSDASLYAIKCGANFVSSYANFVRITNDASNEVVSAAAVQIVDSCELLKSGCFPINSVLVKRNDTKFPAGISVCEDWQYWVQCLRGKNIGTLDIPLVSVHRHENNSTSNELHLILGELLFLNNKFSLDDSGTEFNLRLGKLLANRLLERTSLFHCLNVFFHISKGFVISLAKFWMKKWKN